MTLKHTLALCAALLASTARAQSALIVSDEAIHLGTVTSACPGKACTYHPINMATCTPRLMGGTGVNAQVGGGISGAWMSWWCPSTKGPQLRILAGSWVATVEAVECINKSGKTTAQALPTCAPTSVVDKSLVPIWKGGVSQIVASKP